MTQGKRSMRGFSGPCEQSRGLGPRESEAQVSEGMPFRPGLYLHRKFPGRRTDYLGKGGQLEGLPALQCPFSSN